MRRSPIVLTLAAAALLAACGSSSTPGWTYAPPTEPPASVAPSAAPSGEASAPPASEAPGSEAPGSEAPGSEAPGSEAPASGGTGGGEGITLTASGIKWVEAELAAPAGAEFTLTLDNQDNGVPHDVVITDATGVQVVKSEVVTGVATIDVTVPALTPGVYTYVCSIHPTMVGNMSAGG